MSGWGAIYNNTRMALHLQAQQMARLQEQAASGARVNRASDDPSDAYRILELRAESEVLGEYGSNLEDVTRTLELAHNVLQDISTNLRTVRQKAEQGASGTYGQNNRAILGQEINAILEQMIAMVNAKSLGRHLFSGAKSDTVPYAVETDGEYITAVRYQGSLDGLPVPVAPELEMHGVLVGEKVFRGGHRQEAVFVGHTGAAPGRGTSTVLGSAYLRLAHKETTVVADPDGVNLLPAAGPSPADTILGEHDLIVDVTNGTVRFADGGPLKVFDGTETALEVRNADGDVVHVDVTALNGALVGAHTVTVRSDGYLSLESGPTVELTDFTEDNLVVTDADGRLLYVDAAGIRRTGMEPVRVPGTFELFETLIHTRDVLLNRADLTEEDQLQLLGEDVEAINEVIAGITQVLTSVGARLEALDTLGTSIESIRGIADDQAGTLENADLVQVAAELARAQTLYQMTLATSSKLLSLSLLDFI